MQPLTIWSGPDQKWILGTPGIGGRDQIIDLFSVLVHNSTESNGNFNTHSFQGIIDGNYQIITILKQYMVIYPYFWIITYNYLYPNFEKNYI